jgi:hypothetical protein
MADQAEQVSTNGSVDTKQPKRRQYSEALKRQMVAETLVPRASVSVVARRHEEGVVVLSRAQLSMLLEGIDWRMPRRTWRPELAG